MGIGLLPRYWRRNLDHRRSVYGLRIRSNPGPYEYPGPYGINPALDAQTDGYHASRCDCHLNRRLSTGAQYGIAGAALPRALVADSLVYRSRLDGHHRLRRDGAGQYPGDSGIAQTQSQWTADRQDHE